MGFGRLAGRNTFSNPLGFLSSKFENRQSKRKSGDRGGTLGNINWFQGDASAFFGIQYQLSEKIMIASEYTADTMSRENSYIDVNSPWNFGATYQVRHVGLSAQYLMEARCPLLPCRQPRPTSSWGVRSLLQCQCVFQ